MTIQPAGGMADAQHMKTLKRFIDLSQPFQLTRKQRSYVNNVLAVILVALGLAFTHQLGIW